MAFALPLSAAVAPAAPAESPAYHPRGAMHRLLRQLDLSADQQVRVRGIQHVLKPRTEALYAARRRDLATLATTPPTDPAYAALLEQSKANGAQAIQLRGDVWTQVYVLSTSEQRAKVPALLAAARRRHEARHQARDSRGET
jgi:Spy/CpxP family protein refolding chaperone